MDHLSNTITTDFNKYICPKCGFIYDEEKGDPATGIPAGTRFEALPEIWICTMCGESKSEFVLLSEETREAENITYLSEVNNKPVIAIVGSGLAAWQVVKELREQGNDANIVMYSKNKADYYYRPNLSVSISRHSTAESLILQTAQSRAEQFGVQLKEKVRVIGIDAPKKTLITDMGMYTYDKLILASGSRNKLPRKFRKQNIFSLNYLDDYESLSTSLSIDKQVLIVGAGFIGCELADDLTRTGHSVAMVSMDDSLLKNQVPDPVAKALEDKLCANGLQLYKNRKIVIVSETDDGSFICEMSVGEPLSTEIIIFCTGHVASTGFCKNTAITLDDGYISVDKNMQTTIPSIYALGDCVMYDNLSLKFVDPLYAQAKVLATHLSQPDSILTYSPHAISISVKTQSLPISIYKFEASATPDAWQVIEQEEEGVSVNLFQNGQLIGHVFTGKYCRNIELLPKPDYLGRADFVSEEQQHGREAYD